MVPNNEQNTEHEKIEDISRYLAEISNRMGMNKIQEELKDKSNEENKRQTEEELEKQKKVQQSQMKYDPFHSILRFFNPNTSTNCYKGAILAPSINFIGKLLNFANDEDCEDVSRYFAAKKEDNKNFPWKAFSKVVLSSLGAFIRGIANITDWATSLLFRPLNSFRNLWAAITDPKNATDHINRHYQILEHKPGIEKNKENKEIKENKEAKENKEKTGVEASRGKEEKETEASELTIKTLTLNTGLMRDVYWDASKGFLNNLRRPRERAMEIADEILKMDTDNPQDVICLQEVFDNLRLLGLGKDSQAIIIDRLKEKFPYIVYDVGQRSWPLTGSGLMILSKLPIVDVEFNRYPDLLDLDTLSNKGFVAAKLQKGDRYFTVYNG